MESQVIATLQPGSENLTAAQIKDLDLPTLRLLVAKHVGFKFRMGAPGECYMTVTTPNGVEQMHGNDVFWEIPDYCWSMTQAWQLVEELKKDGIYLTVCTLKTGYDCLATGHLDTEFLEQNPEVTICRWYVFLKQMDLGLGESPPLKGGL